MPVVGLRIRARNVFSLIPMDRAYHRIMDAGSGPGVLTFQLARRFPEARVLGVDILDESVRACRAIAEKVGQKNIAFQKDRIENLEQKNTFDLVLCVDILEHLEDDVMALRGLYDAIAGKGILVLHVPALHRRYPVWKKNLNFYVESHVRVGYKKRDIEEMVKGSGFSIRQSGYTYGFWETLANNISYMVTHARMEHKVLYALLFPFLNGMSLLGSRARPSDLGAGIFVVGEKR